MRWCMQRSYRLIVFLDNPSALLSLSENHARSYTLKAARRKDSSGEFLSETQKRRPIGRIPVLSRVSAFAIPQSDRRALGASAVLGSPQVEHLALRQGLAERKLPVQPIYRGLR
jgi:hypothetical protein